MIAGRRERVSGPGLHLPHQGEPGLDSGRLYRLRQRRRLLKEELVCVLALAVLLGVTVMVLAFEWRQSPSGVVGSGNHQLLQIQAMGGS